MAKAMRVHELRGSMRTVALSAVAMALGGCATMAAYQEELTKTNTQTVLAFQETVFNKHEPREAFDHYVGPTFTQNDPRPYEDRSAALQAYDQLTRTFPHSKMSVQSAVAQGDMVAVRGSWQSAAGARLVQVADFYRLVDGRIVEHWDVVQDAAPGARRTAAPL